MRRPIIISPPYRPPVQFYFQLSAWLFQNYWDQFNIQGLYDRMTEMGYDVIFIKEKPGTVSIEEGGKELAEFIKIINDKKEQDYPDEHWENILMGYSKGGLVVRYALMYLEKEYVENHGKHHHTRLYIPFDSPHNGANVPLFTQAVYEFFSLNSSNFLANQGYQSLNDPASTDQGSQHINGSIKINTTTTTTLQVGPHPNYVAFQNNLSNLAHSYTPVNDLRAKYPAFTRNIAISTGSYKDNYLAEYGLSTNQLMFLSLKHGLFSVRERKIWSSKYSTTQPQHIFYLNDVIFPGTIFEYTVQRTYQTIGALELDNAQGGYKTQFYKSLVGATGIIMSTPLVVLDEFNFLYYDGEMNFLPLVSALGINPNLWQNNNLYYNLQAEDMFYSDYDPISNSYTMTNNYGYPHLGHPNNHFNITPFEAVYADKHTYDHIVMKQTVEDYDDIYFTDLNPLRDFILNEIEADTVYLQNKDYGFTSASFFGYDAWYKARKAIVTGSNVTSKTDSGDYSTYGASITLKAPVVHLKAGTHLIAPPYFTGTNVHILNEISNCDSVYDASYGRIANENNQIPIKASKKNVLSNSNSEQNNSKKTFFKIYPNPNTGNFIFETNLQNFTGYLYIYTIDGKMIYSCQNNKNLLKLNLSLEKGIYIVNFKTETVNYTTKMIIK